MATNGPIGVFDSGLGGLSILREVQKQLPYEDLLYFADCGNAPYGDLPAAQIEARSFAIVEHLRRARAKAVVVACNTATGAAVSALRARFDVPIVAVEPAVKLAVTLTRSQTCAVLATTRTLASENFQRLHTRFGAQATILAQPCPGLADRVEAGDLSSDGTRALIAHYLRPLLARGVDTLVLGCTHYAFLLPTIRELAGPDVQVVDPAPAIARQLERRLVEAGLLAKRARRGRVRLLTTGELEHVRRALQRLSAGEHAVADVSQLERVSVPLPATEAAGTCTTNPPPLR